MQLYNFLGKDTKMERHDLPEKRYWGRYFSDGDAVVHRGRNGHVVRVPIKMVPSGHIPVMYDDESSCFSAIPADDLERRHFYEVMSQENMDEIFRNSFLSED